MASADAEIVQPGDTAGTRIRHDWEMTPERQDSLAAAWDSAINAAASGAGLTVGSEGDKVLRIDARTTRIAPSADFAQTQSAAVRTTVYTEDSGDASVEFRLVDQGSGELLAVIRDKRSLGSQLWSRSSTVTAGADVRNPLDRWARQLVARITGN